MDLQVIGVYPIEADEPCHLIEVKIGKAEGEILDLTKFTQEVSGQPLANWQVPYDEHFLNEDGTADLNPRCPAEMPKHDNLRAAFFFHYLNLEKPLETPVGAIHISKPKEKPARLNFIKYESPY